MTTGDGVAGARTRPRGKELWYNVKHKGEERRRAMPAVMEQIGKMSRVEQIRIARLILEAIENGEVVFGGERPSVNRLNVGLMKAEVDLPSDFDAEFDSLDETISSELVGSIGQTLDKVLTRLMYFNLLIECAGK